MQDLQKQWEKLLDSIRLYGSVAVAFSGGVDSTLLLKAAKEALGDGAVAVTALSPAVPEREQKEAADFCKKEGILQITVDVSGLQRETFLENPKNRCYLCKKALFTQMLEVVRERGIRVLAEGSNLDDTHDYRPGMQAVKELGVKSPLLEAGLTKGQIRSLSRQLSLPTWEKPSYACLATRFVPGEPITEERLHRVEEAEAYLQDLGFLQMRVRVHGTMARIEVLPEQFSLLLADETRKAVHEKFRQIGFSYISADLLGYRTGSMNEK